MATNNQLPALHLPARWTRIWSRPVGWFLDHVIYRTVVKKDGITSNYQKIVYTWGGIFYFKVTKIRGISLM